MRPVASVVCVGLLVLLVARPALAQPDGGVGGVGAQPVGGIGAPAPAVFRPKVRAVRVEGEEDPVAGLGDTLVVTLEPEHVEKLWRSREKLRLYLNARPISALPVHPEPLTQRLRFVLARNETNRTEWDGLLGAWKDKDIRVAVGLLEDGPGESEVSIRTNLFPVGRTVVVTGLGLLLVLTVFVLARRTNLLRDPEPPGTVAPQAPRTYSLGRTQMAFLSVNYSFPSTTTISPHRV